MVALESCHLEFAHALRANDVSARLGVNLEVLRFILAKLDHRTALFADAINSMGGEVPDRSSRSVAGGIG